MQHETQLRVASGYSPTRRLSGDLLWDFGLNQPGAWENLLDEEGLGLDREDHPGLATRVARPCQAQGLFDAPSPYRDPEAGIPATELYR